MISTYALGYAFAHPDADPEPLDPLVTGGKQFSHGDPNQRDAPPPKSRTRVLVVGAADWPDVGAVFAHLTIAWRDAGQPLEVVHERGDHPLARHIRTWLAEHPENSSTPFDPSPWQGTDVIRPKAWRVLAFGDGWGVRVAEQAGLDVRRVAA